MAEVHDPGFTSETIDTLFAVIASDETGEGIVGVRTEQGWMPLVSSQEENVRRYLPIVTEMAKSANKQMSIVEFSTRRVIETINSGRS